ncbi:hypothetical protein MOF30_07785 [Peribacillus frigoritolerans]|nr:hypothetical protein [Peribacillus frigoritolerans]MCY9138373.1 hypothetical protein [Peribacillus frigoritolerans]
MGILEMIISRANTALVMKSGNDSEATIGGNPFKTINGAITAINTTGATGITIFVFPGIYDERIIITFRHPLTFVFDIKKLRPVRSNSYTFRKFIKRY